MITFQGEPLVAAVMLLIQLTLLASFLSIMSKNLLPFRKSEKTRIFAVAIASLALIFTIVISVIHLESEMHPSEAACETTYLVCVTFWLATKFLVYLYFNEKLHLARGALPHGIVVRRFSLTNTAWALLPAPLVIWAVIKFKNHEAIDGICVFELTSFFAKLSLLIYNVLLNAYLTLSFLRLPPPSLQDMLKPNPTKYAWCNIVTSIVPLINLILLLIPSVAKKSWIFVTAAQIDVGIAVVVLGVLEGSRTVTPMAPTVPENWMCEDCDKSAKNGDSSLVDFFDLSLVAGDGQAGEGSKLNIA